MAEDVVDHPKHYNVHPSGVECIAIVQEFGFNIGCAIKHLWRAGLKEGMPTEVDLRKAMKYIEFELERIAIKPAGEPVTIEWDAKEKT